MQAIDRHDLWQQEGQDFFTNELTKGKKKGIIKTRSKTGNGYAEVICILKNNTPTLAEGRVIFLWLMLIATRVS